MNVTVTEKGAFRVKASEVLKTKAAIRLLNQVARLRVLLQTKDNQ